MSESKATIDHEEIKRWVEKRGGHPAAVIRTESKDDVGILRIDFPGYSGEGTLEEISWEDFFSKFDEKKLAFLYQEKTADGHESRFCKLVSQESVAANAPENAPGKSGGSHTKHGSHRHA